MEKKTIYNVLEIMFKIPGEVRPLDYTVSNHRSKFHTTRGVQDTSLLEERELSLTLCADAAEKWSQGAMVEAKTTGS